VRNKFLDRGVLETDDVVDATLALRERCGILGVDKLFDSNEDVSVLLVSPVDIWYFHMPYIPCTS
jgi:hypothetical protein